VKHTARTFIKALPGLALALASLASDNCFAGEYPRHLSEGQPVVLARGNPQAIGRLGFRYENGFGVPQNYAAAADLYHRAAEQGDAFAQCRLGLSYDKGHGVPLDLILAYKWLNLAAARASSREHDFYARLRDAVASKMSLDQVIEGQKLALIWVANWEAERPLRRRRADESLSPGS
jgi:TPR repeat protein